MRCKNVSCRVVSSTRSCSCCAMAWVDIDLRFQAGSLISNKFLAQKEIILLQSAGFQNRGITNAKFSPNEVLRRSQVPSRRHTSRSGECLGGGFRPEPALPHPSHTCLTFCYSGKFKFF